MAAMIRLLLLHPDEMTVQYCRRKATVPSLTTSPERSRVEPSAASHHSLLWRDVTSSRRWLWCHVNVTVTCACKSVTDLFTSSASSDTSGRHGDYPTDCRCPSFKVSSFRRSKIKFGERWEKRKALVPWVVGIALRQLRGLLFWYY